MSTSFLLILAVIAALLPGASFGNKPLGELKTGIQQGKIKSLEIYSIEWLKRTREDITPDQLVKRYDIHILVRLPRFADSVAQSILDQPSAGPGLPDIRLGAVFKIQDGPAVKLFFGHSTKSMLVNDLTVAFDHNLLNMVLGYLPCSQSDEIQTFFKKD